MCSLSRKDFRNPLVAKQDGNRPDYKIFVICCEKEQAWDPLFVGVYCPHCVSLTKVKAKYLCMDLFFCLTGIYIS